MPQIREFFGKQITEPVLADIACAVGLFVVLLIVLGFFNHAISSRVHGSSLGPLDKSLGLVFGLARGIVLVALAHMAMTDWFLPEKSQRPDVINQARTEPYVAMAADFIKSKIPQDWKDKASSVFDDSAKAVEEGVEQGKQLNDTIQKLSPQVPQPTTPPSGDSQGDSSQNGGQGTQRSPAGNQDGQGEQSGYKDAERKDLERLIQGQSQ